MDAMQKALFEAHAILQAHARLCAEYITAPFGQEQEMLAQIDRVKQAAEAFSRLPRPQQRAA